MSDDDSLPAPGEPLPATDRASEEDIVPRTWGFDVHAMNQEYALVTWGSKAVVIKEQSGGSIEDRVRILRWTHFAHGLRTNSRKSAQQMGRSKRSPGRRRGCSMLSGDSFRVSNFSRTLTERRAHQVILTYGEVLGLSRASAARGMCCAITFSIMSATAMRRFSSGCWRGLRIWCSDLASGLG